MSLSRAFQWVGVAAVLLVLVGLNYEFESKAGMQMNAPPESPLSQSLRGYWKMDEGTGTSTTADSSGNGNTLSMTGPPTWTTGNIGPYALDFSGSGQYLSIADPASGVLDIGDNTDFSITGWFNRDTFANDHTIVAKRNSSATNTDAGYIVWIDAAADKLNFTVGDGGGTSGDQYTLASASTFTATGWHQFTAVWDDSLGMQLYIDGKLDNSTTSSTSSIGSLANAVAFRIGAESDAGNPFDGKIDDVRVYGYALSADQVKKVYNTSSPTQPVDTSLVGHWTFDGPDIQGTTAIDRSSFGNNGTITGTTKTIGKLGQGLSFNGSSDSVVTINNLPFSAASSTPFTFSFWLKTTDTSGEIMIWTTGVFCQNVVSGFIGCTVSGDGYAGARSDAEINDNVWHYIVYTHYNNVQNLYIDGVLNDTTTETIYMINPTSELNIGVGETAGVFDDVRVYNRVLSPIEVTDLYNRGK